VLVLVAAALAAAVEPARACSCIPPDPWTFLEKADGAFVGKLVSRREGDEGRVVLTFGVERAVKGKIGVTVEVDTANKGAACGIETSVGKRIGLFLRARAANGSGISAGRSQPTTFWLRPRFRLRTGAARLSCSSAGASGRRGCLPSTPRDARSRTE
jgi:hypothetical protein